MLLWVVLALGCTMSYFGLFPVCPSVSSSSPDSDLDRQADGHSWVPTVDCSVKHAA